MSLWFGVGYFSLRAAPREARRAPVELALGAGAEGTHISAKGVPLERAGNRARPRHRDVGGTARGGDAHHPHLQARFPSRRGVRRGASRTSLVRDRPPRLGAPRPAGERPLRGGCRSAFLIPESAKSRAPARDIERRTDSTRVRHSASEGMRQMARRRVGLGAWVAVAGAAAVGAACSGSNDILIGNIPDGAAGNGDDGSVVGSGSGAPGSSSGAGGDATGSVRRAAATAAARTAE